MPTDPEDPKPPNSEVDPPPAKVPPEPIPIRPRTWLEHKHSERALAEILGLRWGIDDKDPDPWESD